MSPGRQEFSRRLDNPNVAKKTGSQGLGFGVPMEENDASLSYVDTVTGLNEGNIQVVEGFGMAGKKESARDKVIA